MRNILKDRRFFVFKAGSVGFVAIALALLCVFSCNNLLVLGGGSLVIAMPGTRAATASRFTIELTGTNGTTQSKTLAGGTTTAQFDDLAPDTYDIIVKGIDEAGAVVLGGSSSATVTAGKTASTTVELVEVVNNFDSLRQAMTAGGTVYVVNDITVTESLIINQDVIIRALNKEVTLNLASDSTDSMFEVGSGGELTLGGGEYMLTVNGNKKNQSSSLLNITKGGKVHLYGTITNSYSPNKTGIEIGNSSSFYMYDGATVSNCECINDYCRGGAIAVRSGGEMYMYGGTITGNRCYCAAAIYVEGGTFNMYGGTITGNTATSISNESSDLPAAVEISESSKFTQTGGSIIGNSPRDIVNKSTSQ